MATTDLHLPVIDALHALAFVGDLSMGQPIDQSRRGARLAAWLATAMGFDDGIRDEAACVALLRWSGCTANAPEFAEALGDDVGGRRTMLSLGPLADALAFNEPLPPLAAAIHCEVAREIARMLGLSPGVQTALERVWESWDGSGRPRGLARDDVPAPVWLVAAAGDLEIFARVHGLPRALAHLAERAGRRYPAAAVDALRPQAAEWLAALDQPDAGPHTLPLQDTTTPLSLIADVLDLKLPWMTGLSRRVAATASACAAVLGLDAAQQQRLHRAGLIHGIGRTSVPNTVWDAPGPLGEADRERLRLVPYWTGRAAGRIGALRDEAEIASYVDERLDGSGAFRGVKAAAIDTEARVLAVALQWELLRTERPGRPAQSDERALDQLRAEVQAGRLDGAAVEALTGRPSSSAAAAAANAAPTGPAAGLLSARELEVLRRIGLGDSNKEAARRLDISPSTVRAHLENVFRKLECTTRAAATLKAMTLGLL